MHKRINPFQKPKLPVVYGYHDLTIEPKPKASASRLEREITNSPVFPYLTNDDLLPVLLYWGGIRSFVDIANPYDSTRARNDFAFKLWCDNHLKPIYESAGISREGSMKVSDHDANHVYVVHPRITLGQLKNLSKDRNQNLGRNFNYPECCIDNFLDGQGPRAHEDKMEWLFAHTDEEIMQMNTLPYKLHLPCKINCEPSEELAKAYQVFVRTNFPGIAAFLEPRHLLQARRFAKGYDDIQV
ncbi:MAG: hypothetical protein ACE5FT_04800 [Candidatus Nanoarchaeia archaeon]